MPERETVVITGASAGVGRAVAREFAARGARIGLLSRNEERLSAAAAEVERLGGKALILPTDVASAEQVEAAAERVESEFGPIDVWVNNAMTTVFARFLDITPEEYRRATEVTYLGTVYGTLAALKRMYPRDRGVIVQVGSALAYRAIPLQAPYCGAKHAVRGFTDSIRSELLHDHSNVHLTMVQLPALNTPQFNWCKTKLPNHPQPVPPIYQPEVAARAIVWAAHERRREVNVGYPSALTIWLNKLFPALGDHYLARNGFESQQTATPIDPHRPSNLFNTVAGDYGAHGIFDAEAMSESLQFRATQHRQWLLLGAAAAGLAVTGLLLTSDHRE